MKSAAAVAVAFAATALAAGRTSAPKGCLTVAATGGDYATVQAAVDAAAKKPTDQCIFLDKGIYKEQVYVSENTTSAITIYGYTTDTSSYAENGATITASASQKDGLTNDETATLRIHSTNFKLYNVDVVNDYGIGYQALALSAYVDSAYYGCRFTGYQDTVLAERGVQLYAKCYIEGAIDFIFGQYATAWFDSCDIGVLDATLGYIVGKLSSPLTPTSRPSESQVFPPAPAPTNTLAASGRKTADDPAYHVLNGCSVAAAAGQDVPAGAYFLGRPWKPYSRVVVQNSELSDVINSDGYAEWSVETPNTADSYLGEFNNTGPGSEGPRAKFVAALPDPVDITAILGNEYTSAPWYDASYM